MPVKAVIFDLDDTLYPEIQFVRGGFRAVAEEVACLTGLNAHKVYELMMQESARDRNRVMNRIIRRLGIEELVAVEHLVEIYRCHRPALRLFADAERVLPALRSSGYRLGLITDGYLDVQKNKVRALKLEGLLEVIVFTGALGREYWKPHDRAFRMALAALACPPNEAMYVGDNASKDFAAPNRLGMISVQVNRPGGFYPGGADLPPGYEPRYVVNSLLEVIDLFTNV